MNQVKEIIVHHTGGTIENPLADTSHHTFETVNAWHRQDPNIWLGFYSSLGNAIGYHYFIEKSGKVTQGRTDTDEGAHCRGHNRSSIGICLAGNFDVTFPTREQIESLRNLLNQKRKEYLITRDKIVAHRCFANKTCYGRNLSDSWASDLTLDASKPADPIIHTCTAEKAEIAELKERVSWLQKILMFFFKR